MSALQQDRLRGLVGSLAIKAPCEVRTTAAIVLSGLQTIDGVALAEGDYVLVMNQASSIENGLYVVDSGDWERRADFDGAYDVTEGTMVMVLHGTTYSNTYWRLTTTGTIVFGTSALTFAPALSGDAATVSFLQSGAGAVLRTMQDKARDIVSVADYGVVGDDNTKRAANTTALRKLVCTAANGGVYGYKGEVYFPQGRTYYLGGIIACQDGTHLKLGGSTLDFAVASTTAENNAGFIYARRDFSMEDGYINVNYNGGGGGTNRGYAICLNARYSDADQSPGNYFLNNFEEDQTPLVAAGAFVIGTRYTIATVGTTNFVAIGAASSTVGVQFTATGVGAGTGTAGAFMPYMPGNISLRNLRIKSNNPDVPIIQLQGGLKNVSMENIELDGQNLAYSGIDYEFGGATDEVLPENEKSSHGANLSFRNMYIKNLNSAGTGSAMDLRCPYNVAIDGLYVTDAKQVLSVSTGEAANYNPGSLDVAGIKHNLYARNIVGQAITGDAINIVGYRSFLGGYLSPLYTSQTELQSTGLVEAVIENFTLTSSGAGGAAVVSSANKLVLRNGRSSGFQYGLFDTGTRNLVMDAFDIFDSTLYGVRFSNGDVYTAASTDHHAVIRNCEMSGNGTAATGIAILFDSQQMAALIEGNVFGYDTRATATLDVTGGTASAGVNKISSLKVNGVEILNAAVDWTASNTATATAIAASINTKASVPEYTAKSVGTTVIIIAAFGTGTGPNGFVVTPTTAGNMTVGNVKNMTGGLLELYQDASVQVGSGLGLVTCRKNHTRAIRAGGTAAYVNGSTTAANGNILAENSGVLSTVGAWLADKMSFVLTLTGCTVAGTGTALATVKGRSVTLTIPQFTGVSNAITKSLTGLPQVLWPTAGNRFQVGAMTDNSGAAAPGILEVDSTGAINLYATLGLAGWTAANNFVMRTLTIPYELD